MEAHLLAAVARYSAINPEIDPAPTRAFAMAATAWARVVPPVHGPVAAISATTTMAMSAGPDLAVPLVTLVVVVEEVVAAAEDGRCNAGIVTSHGLFHALGV